MSELKTNDQSAQGASQAVMVEDKNSGVGGMPATPKANWKRKWKDVPFIISFLVYPMVLFAIFYVGINFNSILMSFKNITFNGEETWVGFQNFKLFIDNITGSGGANALRWSTGLINSFKMYIISLVICLPLYVLLSYILFKKCFAHKVLRVIVMLPQIISGFIMCLVFKRFMEGAIPGFMKAVFGYENFPPLLTTNGYMFGTTLFYTIWASFSTSLIVYPNAMNEIDDGILEAAQLDGVGNIFQELRYIILPLIFPTISTFLITGFAALFVNAGSIPTFFMYGAPAETVNIGYLYWEAVANAGGIYDGFPMLSAGGLLMTAVMAPLTLLLKKFLEKFDPEVD